MPYGIIWLTFRLKGGHVTETVRLADCLPSVLEDLARQIFEGVEQSRAIENNAFSDGYRSGYETGYEVGFAHAHNEMAAAWHKVFETVQWAAKTKSFAELQQLRYSKNTHTQESRNAA